MKEILKNIKTEYNKQQNQYKNTELFNKIKRQAIYNKKGFSDNRNKIYTYLLKLNEDEDNLSNTAITLTSSHQFKYIKTKILPNELLNPTHANSNSKATNNYFGHKNIEILKKDLPRCIYHHICENRIHNKIDFDDFGQCITHLLLSKDLNYSFYQGYLDVCVYMFTIFPKESNNNPYAKSISSINRITEILLKDYITIPEQGSDTFDQAVNFLSEIISLSDKEIGDKMQKDHCCLCLVLSWVLTLMTHNLDDPIPVYRLLDYLIVAEPYAIYVFTSLILLNIMKKADETITKGRKLSIESQSSQSGIEKYYAHLSGISFDKLDFNDYIQKTDIFINKNTHQINQIRKKYSKSLKSICDVDYHGIIDFLIPSNRKRKGLNMMGYFILVAIVFLVISFFIMYLNSKSIVFKPIKDSLS